MEPNAHMTWLFDYMRVELGQNFFDLNSTEQPTEGVNMARFENFITTFPYKAWTNGVRFHYADAKK